APPAGVLPLALQADRRRPMWRPSVSVSDSYSTPCPPTDQGTGRDTGRAAPPTRQRTGCVRSYRHTHTTSNTAQTRSSARTFSHGGDQAPHSMTVMHGLGREPFGFQKTDDRLRVALGLEVGPGAVD